MKDSEFIELLNLYLDHEISAAEAARLESEVQTNPDRRRIYQDYCRMQKACRVLARDFASEPEAADHKVVAFNPGAHSRSGSRRGTYFAGAFAAVAACLVAVVTLRHGSGAPAAAVQTQRVAAVTPASAVAVSTTSTAAPQAREAFSIQHRAHSESLALGTPTDPQFVWMQNVRLSPIKMPAPGDQLQLETNGNMNTQSRTFESGRQPLPDDVHWIAIRFQK